MVAVVAFGATTAIADHLRIDWNCPGVPYDACYAPADHTYDKVTAINTANAYRKCAKIQDRGSGYVFSRICASEYYVNAYYHYGLATINDQYVSHAAVGNDTGIHHGLRGAARY